MEKLKQFLKSEKISTFSSKDENEFYKFLKNSPDINPYAFENNWSYILQATRNGQYKFYSKNSLVYFTLRFKKQSKSNFVVIVNFLGKNRNEAVLEFCEMLKENKINVLIKNVDKKELPFWEKQGFIESIKPWSKYSFRDDNSFPQMVFLLEDVLTMKKWSHGNRHIIRKYRKFPNIHTEFYSPNFRTKGVKLLKDHSKYSFEKGKDFEEEIYRAHTFFFNEDIQNKIRLKHIRDGQLIALHFFTKVNDILFWNALININESNIMRILFFEALRFIKTEIHDIKYVVCQGSESEGQHRFKMSFKPISVTPKTHIVLK